jgi:tripartite-type tricarboxylate transporter receptor subunit TctC
LAVSTSKRAGLLPQVPTMKELGYDVDVALWYGVFVKAGTPQPIVDRIASALRSTMKSETVRKRWVELGLEHDDLYGPDFVKFYASELHRWGVLLPPLGIPKE